MKKWKKKLENVHKGSHVKRVTRDLQKISDSVVAEVAKPIATVMGGRGSKGVSDAYVQETVNNKMEEARKKHKIDLENLRSSMVSPEEADAKAQMAAREAALAARDDLERMIGERLTGEEVNRLIAETNDLSQRRLKADMEERFNVVHREIHDVQSQVRQHGEELKIMWKQREEDTKVLHSAIQANTTALFKIMERQDKDSKETNTRLEQLMLTQSQDRKDTNDKMLTLMEQQSKDRAAMLEIARKGSATSSESGASGGPSSPPPVTECPICSSQCKLLFCQHYFCRSCHVRNGKIRCPVCEKEY